MTTTPTDDVMRKIRGLLAKAEDSAVTPAEAEAYTAKAEALMFKYAIDAALLAESDRGPRDVPSSRRIDLTGGYPMPKAVLLTGIAEAFGGKALYSNQRGKTPYVLLFGFTLDLDVMEVLYTSLTLQVAHALAAAPRSDRSYRTQFWKGYAVRVGDRIAAERATAVAETPTPGAGLVLADRAAQVDQHMRREGPKYRETAVTSSAGVGLADGATAAERADLGHTRVGNHVPALAGR